MTGELRAVTIERRLLGQPASHSRSLLLEHKQHLGAHLLHPICIASKKYPKSVQSDFETARKICPCFYASIFCYRGRKDHSFAMVTCHPYLDVISDGFSASILPTCRHNAVLSSLKTSRNSPTQLKSQISLFNVAAADFLSSMRVCVYTYVWIINDLSLLIH